jgi:hypothetical protein
MMIIPKFFCQLQRIISNHKIRENTLVLSQHKIVVSPTGHRCAGKDFCRTELKEQTALSLLFLRLLCEYSLHHNLIDTTPGCMWFFKASFLLYKPAEWQGIINFDFASIWRKENINAELYS